MIIHPSKLRAAYRGLSVLFYNGLTMVEQWAEPLCNVLPSTTRIEDYGFLEDIGELEEFVGSMTAEDLRGRAVSVENKWYRKPVKMNVRDIRDDKLGLYAQGATLLGEKAANVPQVIVLPILLNAHTAKYATYDGQPLESAAHPQDPDRPSLGVQSNYYASGMGPTPANFEHVYGKMRSLVNAYGQPLNIRPDTVLHSPEDLSVWERIIKMRSVAVPVGANAAAAEDNPNYNRVRLVEVPGLPKGSWKLCQLGNKVKRAIIFQRRTPPNMTRDDTKLQSEGLFVLWANAECSAAPAIWQTWAGAKA